MNERLTFLLEKYLQGTTTPKEKAELFDYIRDERHGEDIQARIEREFDKRGESVGNSEELYQAILKKNGIRQKKEYHNYRLIGMRAAASVALIVGVLWLVKLYLPKAHVGPNEGENPTGYSLSQESEFIRLPDGSTVTLKGNSTLTPLYENGLFTRKVVLEGEAFFDVQPDKKQAFVVYSGEVSTKVLGTSFFIRTLDKATEVTVTRGIVEVSRPDKSYGKLQANEQLTIDQHLGESSRQVLTDPEIELLSADLMMLVFDETPLKEVLQRVEQKFGYTITLENTELEKCRISASFINGEKLEEILDLICQMRHASYAKEGTHIIIKQGKLCT